MEKIPIVHLYAQHQWHDDAYVLADREGLLALRDAITKALRDGQGEAEAFVRDGEGFSVRVIINDEDLPAWQRIAVPYTSNVACEKDTGALWPWDIWRE